MKTTVILLISFGSLCCGCTSTPMYRNVEDFESEISSWKVIGLPLTEAALILSRKGFTCRDLECSRDAGSFPCVQHQWITLLLDEADSVSHVTVEKVRDGQLPSSCV